MFSKNARFIFRQFFLFVFLLSIAAVSALAVLSPSNPASINLVCFFGLFSALFWVASSADKLQTNLTDASAASAKAGALNRAAATLSGVTIILALAAGGGATTNIPTPVSRVGCFLAAFFLSLNLRDIVYSAAETIPSLIGNFFKIDINVINWNDTTIRYPVIGLLAGVFFAVLSEILKLTFPK